MLAIGSIISFQIPARYLWRYVDVDAVPCSAIIQLPAKTIVFVLYLASQKAKQLEYGIVRFGSR